MIIWEETVAGRREGSASLRPGVFRRQPGGHAATGRDRDCSRREGQEVNR